MDAYILVESKHGPLREMAAAFQALAVSGSVVRAVDVVTGPYEFVIRVRADNLDALSLLVREGIQPVVGVASTTTCIAWRS